MNSPFFTNNWYPAPMEFADQLEALAVIALAGFLGSIIGFEREMAHKPAGLRTHIFVAASSALLIILGESMIDSYQADEGVQAISADPIRIVQAIVVGISFLGAGTIFRHRHADVKGLTTAASILLTACVGIAAGSRHFVLAIGVAIMAVVVLHGLNGFSRLAAKIGARRESENKRADDAVEAEPPSDGN